jgi:uroporphyrinogen decarboxylase
MAALRGEAVDRPPLAFWMHNYVTENTPETMASESVRLAREFDWDYLKPQCRAQCFAEMWGLRYEPSGDPAVSYRVTHAPCAEANDLAKLSPADARGGVLGEQLQALRLIRAAVGPDTPIVWTVFSPLMVIPYLLRGGRNQALALLRSDAPAVEHALSVIAETLASYSQACVEGGADGIFYATNLAADGLLTKAECRKFQRPSDERVLDAVSPAPFNVLHICGSHIHFDEFTDYAVHAFSWAAAGPGNPSLSEGHKRTGRASLGGLPARPLAASLTAQAMAQKARGAIAEMCGRWLLLAPDCSVDPRTPAELLHGAKAGTEPRISRIDTE